MWLVGGIENTIQYKNRWANLFIAVRKYMKKSVTPVRKVRQKVRFLAHSWKQGKTKCTDTEQSVSWAISVQGRTAFRGNLVYHRQQPQTRGKSHVSLD